MATRLVARYIATFGCRRQSLGVTSPRRMTLSKARGSYCCAQNYALVFTLDTSLSRRIILVRRLGSCFAAQRPVPTRASPVQFSARALGVPCSLHCKAPPWPVAGARGCYGAAGTVAVQRRAACGGEPPESQPNRGGPHQLVCRPGPADHACVCVVPCLCLDFGLACQLP